MGSIIPAAAALLLAAPWAFAGPVVKSGAMDQDLVARHHLPARFIGPRQDDGERVLRADIGWMSDVNCLGNLTFCGYREREDSLRFALVVACEPENDRLLLLLLETGESPLDALRNQARRRALTDFVLHRGRGGKTKSSHAGLLELSLRRAISQKLLGPPIPVPKHMYAVAANFPSHLQYDLAIGDRALVESLSKSRARVFLKYPPTPPPGTTNLTTPPFSGLIGPFDDVEYPASIRLPAEHEEQPPGEAETRLDYEVEIGLVMGQTLTWDSARSMDDAALRGTVAGYVLLGDTKARNPQVLGKIAGFDRVAPPGSEPYLVGDAESDEALGYWDPTTAHWWSYAAGWGNFASLGPFLVATQPSESFVPRGLIAARSYASERERGAPPPKGRSVETLYVRQATYATEEIGHRDRMIWTVPHILRSILAPGNALRFLGEAPRLEPGDVVSLGTPGGTVITAKPHKLVDLLEDLIFWWDARDWHDAFFERDDGLYLRHGDELFYWAEGLGFQHLRMRRVSR